jgi:competence protein ComEA
MSAQMSKLLQNLLWALMGAAIAGGVFVILNTPQRADITILLPTPTTSGPLQAHLTGAVANPGLYTLPPGSRVNDLLSAAGGSLPEADLASVNLARPLRDGEQVHVPLRGETAQASASAPGGQRVNINTAGLEELTSLPGIGQVRAQAIVDYRFKNGPFSRTDELMNLPGIGSATYQGLKDLVTVG